MQQAALAMVSMYVQEIAEFDLWQYGVLRVFEILMIFDVLLQTELYGIMEGFVLCLKGVDNLAISESRNKLKIL